MPDFTSDELALERAMQDDGIERYRSMVLIARQADMLTRLPTGRSLVRQSLERVEELIRAYRKKAKGRAHVAAKYIRLVEPPVAALLALTVVIDGLHRPRGVASLGAAIGRAIEDEFRFRAFARGAPGVWQKEVQQRVARSGPTHRRRTAVYKGRRAGVLPKPWPNNDKARAGLVLLECVIQATGLVEILSIREGPRRQRNVAYPTREAVEWLEEADERAARLQPLYMPTVDLPAPWEGMEGGGYLTDLVLNRPIARFRGRGHRRLVEVTDPAQYQEVLSALNKLQSVPWRVGEPTLVTLEHLLDVHGGPLERLADEPLPVKPADIAENEETRNEWRRKAGRVRDGNFRKRSSRILARRTLHVARRVHSLGKPFYFPHGLDFRGRAYPRPVWLQPQGPDLARCLLHTQPEPLTQAGWRALVEYGPELYGSASCLDLPGIRRIYQDPLDESWWTEAEKPFQFLAWCLEVGAAIEAGFPRKPYMASFPVYIDASNNGLQLYSLLTGDRDLARRTNVLPGLKADLYQEVADAAWVTVQRDAKEGVVDALEWLRALSDGLPRKGAKRQVMTKAYDVTIWSAADYTLEWYWDHFDPNREHGGPIEKPGRACRYLARILANKVDELCPGAVAGMEWIKGIAATVASKGLPFQWTSPSGWPVLQEYRKSSSLKVRSILGGCVRRVNLARSSGPADLRKQVQAAAPNFVHSVDAAIMARAVSSFKGPIAAIHDAFGTHPNYIGELHACLRAAVVDVALKKRPFDMLKHELETTIGLEVPDPPRFGEIEPEEVMAAEHLFG